MFSEFSLLKITIPFTKSILKAVYSNVYNQPLVVLSHIQFNGVEHRGRNRPIWMPYKSLGSRGRSSQFVIFRILSNGWRISPITSQVCATVEEVKRRDFLAPTTDIPPCDSGVLTQRKFGSAGVTS